MKTPFRQSLGYKFLSIFILMSFSLNSILPSAYAQVQPIPSGILQPSPSYNPVLVKGLTIHPDNPLEFDFIVDHGDTSVSAEKIQSESLKMIKYFLASLTVPEKEMWVNLSPHEKDRIIPDKLGTTEMGRDMLTMDYLLKQLTASMVYPERETGKKFWEQIYAKTQKELGTTDIPLNTFNKVWIVPEKAVIYEHEGSAFVVGRHLKVMLADDYENQRRSLAEGGLEEDYKKDGESHQTKTSEETSNLIREIILPAIEKEVNEGQNFSTLRQIYNSMILATWYKRKLKESLLAQVYVDQNKIRGIDTEDKNIKEKIYNQYLEAFKKGVYDYIKEEYDPATQSVIPKKYFSGGLVTAVKNLDIETNWASLARDEQQSVPAPDHASIVTWRATDIGDKASLTDVKNVAKQAEAELAKNGDAAMMAKEGNQKVDQTRRSLVAAISIGAAALAAGAAGLLLSQKEKDEFESIEDQLVDQIKISNYDEAYVLLNSYTKKLFAKDDTISDPFQKTNFFKGHIGRLNEKLKELNYLVFPNLIYRATDPQTFEIVKSSTRYLSVTMMDSTLSTPEEMAVRLPIPGQHSIDRQRVVRVPLSKKIIPALLKMSDDFLASQPNLDDILAFVQMIDGILGTYETSEADPKKKEAHETQIVYLKERLNSIFSNYNYCLISNPAGGLIPAQIVNPSLISEGKSTQLRVVPISKERVGVHADGGRTSIFGYFSMTLLPMHELLAKNMVMSLQNPEAFLALDIPIDQKLKKLILVFINEALKDWKQRYQQDQSLRSEEFLARQTDDHEGNHRQRNRERFERIFGFPPEQLTDLAVNLDDSLKKTKTLWDQNERTETLNEVLAKISDFLNPNIAPWLTLYQLAIGLNNPHYFITLALMSGVPGAEELLETIKQGDYQADDALATLDNLLTAQGAQDHITNYLSDIVKDIQTGDETKNYRIDDIRTRAEFVYETLNKLWQKTLPDAAMNARTQEPTLKTEQNPGGIDLNSELMDLQILRDEKGVPLPLPQQPIKQMKIEGFLPVIINITPATNLPTLLGLKEEKPAAPLASHPG